MNFPMKNINISHLHRLNVKLQIMTQLMNLMKELLEKGLNKQKNLSKKGRNSSNFKN